MENSFATAIWSIIFLIGTITASLYILSTIPLENLNRSVGALAAIGGIMIGILVAFFFVSNIFNLFNNVKAAKAGNIVQIFRDPIKSMALAFDILALGLVEMAAAIAIIASTGLKASDLWGYAGILLVSLLVLGALAAGIGVFTAVCKGVNPADVMLMAFTIDLLAGAIGIIALSLGHLANEISGIKTGKVWLAFGIMSLTLTVMSVLLGALSAITISGDVLVTALALVAFSVAMGIAFEAITNALKAILRSGITMEQLGGIVDEIKTLLVIVGLFAVIVGYSSIRCIYKICSDAI